MDLTIELTPSLIRPVKGWIRNFKKREPNWAAYPRLRGRYLRINPLAFPFLLAYANIKDSNELDLERLKRSGRAALEEGLQLEPAHHRLFRHALKNLDFIQPGEFLFATAAKEVLRSGE